MKLHYFQHVPFEGAGCIQQWAASRNYSINATRWDLGEKPPDLSAFDMLLLMGGPMSVHDTGRYPWLSAEKTYLQGALGAGKTILGICLGAQLVAEALGAEVFTNKYPEIGWFPVTRSEHLIDSGLNIILPPIMEVFHWHGETFNIPKNCTPVAASEACASQGFLFGNRVIGLQFHLELTMESAATLVDNCRNELRPGKYMQTEAQLLGHPGKFQQANTVMNAILEYLEGQCS